MKAPWTKSSDDVGDGHLGGTLLSRKIPRQDSGDARVLQGTETAGQAQSLLWPHKDDREVLHAALVTKPLTKTTTGPGIDR